MPKFPAEHVHWKQVASTNVAAIGWDSSQHMFVSFKTRDGLLVTSVYMYEGVSRQKAVKCACSASVGRYLNEKIKPHHRAVKIA